jgi:transcriptional regulator with XRE-family HTH domain
MALRNEEIGQRLTSLRQQKGNPPQEVVASEVGVSYRSYQAWEGGQTKPSWRNLTRLAEFYGVTPEWILIGEEEERPAGLEGRLASMEAQLTEVLDALTRAGLTEPADPRAEMERLLEERVEEERQAHKRDAANEATAPGRGRQRKAR